MDEKVEKPFYWFGRKGRGESSGVGFIGVPKTAGNGISKHINKFHFVTNGAHGHISSIAFKLGMEEFERALIFACVRNPWKRFVSLCEYVKKHAPPRVFVAQRL